MRGVGAAATAGVVGGERTEDRGGPDRGRLGPRGMGRYRVSDGWGRG